MFFSKGSEGNIHIKKVRVRSSIHPPLNGLLIQYIQPFLLIAATAIREHFSTLNAQMNV